MLPRFQSVDTGPGRRQRAGRRPGSFVEFTDRRHPIEVRVLAVGGCIEERASLLPATIRKFTDNVLLPVRMDTRLNSDPEREGE